MRNLERFAAVAAMVALTGIGYFGGRMDGWWAARYEAVDAGHAEFFLDANHKRRWRWLPTHPERPER